MGVVTHLNPDIPIFEIKPEAGMCKVKVGTFYCFPVEESGTHNVEVEPVVSGGCYGWDVISDQERDVNVIMSHYREPIHKPNTWDPYLRET